MKIMIVDDKKNIRDEIKSAMQIELSSESPEILEASDGIEAIHIMAENHDIDVIILDQEMGPKIKSGMEFLKNMPYRANRPRIMILTSYPRKITAQEVIEVSRMVDFFLIKDVPAKLICHAALMMAKGRQSTFPKSDGDVFGTLFCQEIDERCLELSDMLKGNSKIFLNLIQSCARTFMISNERSTEELFQYVVSFNEAASVIANFPEKFTKLLRKFPEVERALYKIPEYRDHFIHQMQVFLLGFCILSEMRIKAIEVDDSFGLHNDSWIQKWFLTSGFHDIGYPFERMNDWLDSFFKDMLELEKVPFVFNWGAIISWGDHLNHFNMLVDKICLIFQADSHQQNCVRREMARCIVVNPNHGLLSALILLNLYDSEDSIDAAVAICLHDLKMAKTIRDILERPLTFNEAPLACLLAFCDTAQEWGRMKPKDMPQIASQFGSPRYQSFRYDKGTMILNLIYPKTFFGDMQNEWKKVIHGEELLNVQQCWNANRLFNITYWCTNSQGQNVKLGMINI